MQVTEILFLFSLLLIFYIIAGYGLLVYVINKSARLKKFFKAPVNAVPAEINEKMREPKVSLIISMYNEDAATVNKKIQNTLELDYPPEKLEVFFAAAFGDNPEMIDELNAVILANAKSTGASSENEELYVRFRELELTNTASRPERVNTALSLMQGSPFDSDMVQQHTYATMKFLDISAGREKQVNLRITKDVERKGKIRQINRTIKQCTGDIIIFCDADTELNKDAIRLMVHHFADNSVGCVAGEKRIKKNNNSSSGEGEGLYWKYESFLKKLDSDLWSAVGAAGELFAVRKTLLNEDIPVSAIIEDFVLSLDIARRGYRVIYEPGAYASEEPTKDIQSEFLRKRRITAGGFQAIWWLRPLFNMAKYRALSFSFISHRVLRWALLPLLMPSVFILNLLIIDISIAYTILLLLQVLFYLSAALGMMLETLNIKIKAFSLPFFFTMMNVAAYSGFYRLVSGKQNVLWEKAKRATT